jgi:hypothetical protein
MVHDCLVAPCNPVASIFVSACRMVLMLLARRLHFIWNGSDASDPTLALYLESFHNLVSFPSFH